MVEIGGQSIGVRSGNLLQMKQGQLEAELARFKGSRTSRGSRRARFRLMRIVDAQMSIRPSERHKGRAKHSLLGRNCVATAASCELKACARTSILINGRGRTRTDAEIKPNPSRSRLSPNAANSRPAHCPLIVPSHATGTLADLESLNFAKWENAQAPGKRQGRSLAQL